MNSLLSYYISPKYALPNKKIGIGFIVKLLFIYFVSSLLLGLIAHFICGGFEIVKTTYVTSRQTILLGVIIAPIVEEYIFRSLLVFHIKNLLAFCLLTLSLIIWLLLKKNTEIAMILFLILASIIFVLLLFKQRRVEKFIAQYFRYFLYFSVLSFGFTHLLNFSGRTEYILLFAPIIVGPQLLLGAILGYIRMIHGLRYSILFHIIVNSSLLFSMIHG